MSCPQLACLNDLCDNPSSPSVSFPSIYLYSLILYFQLGCESEFSRTSRMSPAIHRELLEMVRPLITRQRTNFREPISAEERLSLTIRYLTTGTMVFLKISITAKRKWNYVHIRIMNDRGIPLVCNIEVQKKSPVKRKMIIYRQRRNNLGRPNIQAFIIYQIFLKLLFLFVTRWWWNYRKKGTYHFCCQPGRNLGIPKVQAFVVYQYLLFLFSPGDSVTTLHQAYLIGRSSVYPIIRDTCRAIYSMLKDTYLAVSIRWFC